MDCCINNTSSVCPICGTMNDDYDIQKANYNTEKKPDSIPILSELDQFNLTDEVKIDVTQLHHFHRTKSLEYRAKPTTLYVPGGRLASN